MISLPGYRISTKIHTGTKTQVYRGRRERDRLPIAMKLLNSDYPGFSQIVQFRNQYTIAKNLEHPGIIRPYSLEPYQNSYALVMEDFGGISLSQYARRQQQKSQNTKNNTPSSPFSITEVLTIAIQLVDILHYLIGHRVIHKDIKPANILIHPKTKQVKLIDFSIASLLPRETQEIQNPNVLEGTLAYLSPEQTGRMNRGIDYRTDFYSLGVTFYELLTGQRPFSASDPMELVHCHLAHHPISPIELNPALPESINEIVLKLMAKKAEDRYQSALGLRHDLEKCLEQWQATGAIVPFPLGERDITQHFAIPEKLYGREAEVATLLAAFERVSAGTTEVMLVSGFSGIGKTAVVNEVHKPIVQKRGYFIQGKFDQFKRNIPFFSLVKAFQDLVRQLLTESEQQVQGWKTKILTALGDNAQVIVEVIPELEQMIGKQPPVPQLSGSANTNRFNLLFQKFMRVFATAEHPLVIFLDDLQWADAASLNLLQLLLSEGETHHLLLVGAYRDNEVSPAHPLMLTVEVLYKAQVIINQIALANLNFYHLNRLISDTLSCAAEKATQLTKLVMEKTQGNPFFCHQFLKSLHENALISFSERQGQWQYDTPQIERLISGQDVVEFMANQLRKLPAATQKILQLAACIGNQFDLATLAIVCEQSETETAVELWSALQEGLILPANEIYKFFQKGEDWQQESNGFNGLPIQGFVTEGQVPLYKFLHDRVQQAAYYLIPEPQKQFVHLKIGRVLLQKTPLEKRDDKIFEIVNQLNLGLNLITHPPEREELARLNLIAGQKAKASTAYAAAVKYLSVGRELLAADSWHQAYDLTLALYEAGAEAAYLNTDFGQMEQLAAAVLQHARTPLDRVNVYATQIQSNVAQVKLLEAIRIALDVLPLIDESISFPERPTQKDFEQVLAETRRNLSGKSIADLSHLHQMAAPEKLAAMRILASVAPPAYFACPELLPLIAMRMVNLSVQFGNTSSSAFGYAMYGFILCGMTDEIASGYQFGQLAIELVERFNAKEIKAKALLLANYFINPWKLAIRSTLPCLRDAYQAGLEAGDLEFSGYSASFYCFSSLFVGLELSGLEQEIFTYGEAVAQLKQDHVLHQNYLSRQAALNLLGRSDDPCRLIGDAYSEIEMLPLHEQANNRTTLAFLYVTKLSLCYLFGEYEQAAEHAILAEQYLDGAVAMLCVALFYFYDSLVQLALYTQANPNRSVQELEWKPPSEGLPLQFPHESNDRSQILSRVDRNQARMRCWADSAPMNYLHKFYLVEAERDRILGRKSEAIAGYERAIAGAKENEYVHEEALAEELAARFYLEQGEVTLAQTHLLNSYYAYTRWGATAKINHLERCYPKLLASVLSKDTLRLTSNRRMGAIATTSISSSTSGSSALLDLASVMKISQVLSGEIHRDRLLSKLMKIAIENAGAEKCALVLPQTKGWEIEVMVDKNTTEARGLQPTPVESCHNVPTTIINYVARTKDALAIDDAATDMTFAADAYICQHQPHSILCMPLLLHGQLTGMLYLENNLIAGAFTCDRVEVLNILCSQAAISLENARLYQELRQSESREREKNKQLERSLQELQQAQLQIVQSEKMSTLGQLVAGVAHEVNNPIGFIEGNLTHAREYVEDLFSLISLYQQYYPQTVPAIQQEIEAIDFPYLQEDLPKLLESMKVGSDRIRNISTSLRTFSRSDTAEKVPFNIHEGIESTLLILKHRLKANEERPTIEVLKGYGELPDIKCFPGQLNQVFMNIIANAIDALDEASQGRPFADIAAHPNRITIRTEVSTDCRCAVVFIKDNGSGISEATQRQIFNRLFTTKAVGKGTGLGLAIAQQIVEEKHSGTLTCTSEIGKGTEFVIELPIS